MLQYMQGRFHLGGGSFAIPEGFFLDPTPSVPADNGLSLYSPDDKYALNLAFEEDVQSTDAMLNSLFSEAHDFELFQPIAPIQVNGLSGHYAVYHGENDQYYEARFQVGDDCHLAILVRTDHEVGIKNIISTQAFHELLNCVRKD